MKPLHVVPTNLGFNNTSQEFLNIFIPANYWADLHRLILEFGFRLDSVINEDSDPFGLQEFYNIQDLGDIAQSSEEFAPSGTHFGVANIAMEFMRIGPDVYDITQFTNSAHLGVPNFFSVQRWQQVNPPDTPVDFTTDINFRLKLASEGATDDDLLTMTFAQGYIQSPLNIRRYT